MAPPNHKSTLGEAVIAFLLGVGISASSVVYLIHGGRGWVFGALLGLIFLIALVAGIAER